MRASERRKRSGNSGLKIPLQCLVSTHWLEVFIKYLLSFLHKDTSIARVVVFDNSKGDMAAGLFWEWEHNRLPK